VQRKVKKAMKYSILLPFFLIGIMALAGRPDVLPVADGDSPVHEVLRSLGAPERADVKVRPTKGASADLGRALVLEGSLNNGKQQSAHFQCTSCHNTVKEDPVLTVMDPEARLAYATENGLPFLPGTTLWGAVNRESYYNGDYEKKYGDLVENARRNLRGAIQLCATECAQGEPLNEVEMESVVAYLHEIGLKMKDLPAMSGEMDRINRAIDRKDKNNDGLIKEIKMNYLLASPATFGLPPKDRKAGYASVTNRNPANGKAVYEQACLHCHEKKRYSFFELAERQDHYAFMTKHFPRYKRYSTYQVARYGTSPIPGKRAYMPHYTIERMSNQQIEDLRGYLAGAASR